MCCHTAQRCRSVDRWMFLGELLLWMGGQGSIVLAVATTGTSASSASTGWQTNRAILRLTVRKNSVNSLCSGNDVQSFTWHNATTNALNAVIHFFCALSRIPGATSISGTI